MRWGGDILLLLLERERERDPVIYRPWAPLDRMDFLRNNSRIQSPPLPLSLDDTVYITGPDATFVSCSVMRERGSEIIKRTGFRQTHAKGRRRIGRKKKREKRLKVPSHKEGEQSLIVGDSIRGRCKSSQRRRSRPIDAEPPSLHPLYLSSYITRPLLLPFLCGDPLTL